MRYVLARPVPSEALLRGLVLKPPIDPGVAEIGDLGDDQKIVATKRLALVPLALLRHLAAVVGLVIILPESVEGDVVVGHLAAREGIGPDISTDVPDSHHANGFVLTASSPPRHERGAATTRRSVGGRDHLAF